VRGSNEHGLRQRRDHSVHVHVDKQGSDTTEALAIHTKIFGKIWSVEHDSMIKMRNRDLKNTVGRMINIRCARAMCPLCILNLCVVFAQCTTLHRQALTFLL